MKLMGPTLALLACAGIAISYGGGDGARRLSTFHVYTSVEGCVQDDREDEACTVLEADAQKIAARLRWPFNSADACASSFGASQCYQRDGQWRVKMAGFTPFGSNPDFRYPLPVFKSDTHPGLYLPNGYPVIEGRNSMLGSLLAQNGYLAGQPRSLEASVCPSKTDPQTCLPVHEIASGLSMDTQTVTALFSQG